MEPTIKSGNIIVVSYAPLLFKKPTIGDIILFNHDNKMFVKRIKKKDGEKYFLGGDNKDDSLDSRKIGWITKKEIVGKIIGKLQ